MPAPAKPPRTVRVAPHLVLVLVLAGVGCARQEPRFETPETSASAGGASGAPAPGFPRSRAIAGDFVAALGEIDALDPATTTFYTAPPPSRFGERLLLALQEAGYELRVGDGDAGAALAYTIEREAGASDRYAFELVAGPWRLTRRYRVDEGGTLPLASMRVERLDVPIDAAGRARPAAVATGAAAESRSARSGHRADPRAAFVAGRARDDTADAERVRDDAAGGEDATRNEVPDDGDGRRSRRAAFLAGRLDRAAVATGQERARGTDETPVQAPR